MTTVFMVGHNLPGYSPSSDVWPCATFEEAKAVLLDDLDHAADSAADMATGPAYWDMEAFDRDLAEYEEALAMLLDATGPEFLVYAGSEAWWINCEQGPPGWSSVSDAIAKLEDIACEETHND
jgi:hypothetical protein